jgi:hypothetical protein
MGTFKDTLKLVAKAHPIGQVVTAMKDIKEHEALMATSTPTPPPPPAPAPVAVVPTLPVTPLVPPPPGASPMGKPRPTLRMSPMASKTPVEDLTPLQQSAVAGVSDRPIHKVSPPTPRPAPTPIERPRLKVNMERVTPEPPAPRVFTPQQLAAIEGVKKMKEDRLASPAPSATAPAKSRAQRRVMGEAAIARIRESLNNPKP